MEVGPFKGPDRPRSLQPIEVPKDNNSGSLPPFQDPSPY